MANPHNVHHSSAIIQSVDDAVVTNANAPKIPGTSELARAPRPWIRCERLDACNEATNERWVESLQLFSS
jgi:hypothetical protein